MPPGSDRDLAIYHLGFKMYVSQFDSCSWSLVSTITPQNISATLRLFVALIIKQNQQRAIDFGHFEHNTIPFPYQDDVLKGNCHAAHCSWLSACRAPRPRMVLTWSFFWDDEGKNLTPPLLMVKTWTTYGWTSILDMKQMIFGWSQIKKAS